MLCLIIIGWILINVSWAVSPGVLGQESLERLHELIRVNCRLCWVPKGKRLPHWGRLGLNQNCLLNGLSNRGLIVDVDISYCTDGIEQLHVLAFFIFLQAKVKWTML